MTPPGRLTEAEAPDDAPLPNATGGSCNAVTCINCGASFGTGVDMEGFASYTPAWHVDPDTGEYTCQATDKKVIQ